MQTSDYGIMNSKAVVMLALNEWSNTTYPRFLAESKTGCKCEIFFSSKAFCAVTGGLLWKDPSRWKEDNKKTNQVW